MGAGGLNGVLNSQEVIKNLPEIGDLSEDEIDELYLHLKTEFDKKLRDLTVRKMETHLIKQIKVLNSNVPDNEKKRAIANSIRSFAPGTESTPNLLEKPRNSSIKLLEPHASEKSVDASVEENCETVKKTSGEALTQRLLGRLADENPNIITPSMSFKKHMKKAAQYLPTQPVQTKALKMLGDEKLELMSKELVPKNAQVNNKALKKLGEEKILPERVQKRLGGPMTADQIRKQKQETDLLEQEKIKNQQRVDQFEVERAQAEEDNLGF